MWLKFIYQHKLKKLNNITKVQCIICIIYLYNDTIICVCVQMQDLLLQAIMYEDLVTVQNVTVAVLVMQWLR